VSVQSRSAAVLQASADENLLTAFGLLVPYAVSAAAGTATFGGAVAIASGARSPFFNPIIVVDSSVIARDVGSTVEWSRARGIEPSLQVRSDLDETVAAVAAELGLVADPWLMPGMALDPIPETIPPKPAELELTLVRTDADLDAWYDAAGAGMRAVIPARFAFDPAVRLAVGSVDGQPVCHSIVVDSPRALGIYAVGTRKDVRGRGYGRAITWAAIEAGRDTWGGKPVILQSSEMGERVYRAMGFVEICRYVIYAPPSD
jgi:GNAT superfamily N-acetyltransferase